MSLRTRGHWRTERGLIIDKSFLGAGFFSKKDCFLHLLINACAHASRMALSIQPIRRIDVLQISALSKAVHAQRHNPLPRHTAEPGQRGRDDRPISSRSPRLAPPGRVSRSIWLSAPLRCPCGASVWAAIQPACSRSGLVIASRPASGTSSRRACRRRPRPRAPPAPGRPARWGSRAKALCTQCAPAMTARIVQHACLLGKGAR